MPNYKDIIGGDTVQLTLTSSGDTFNPAFVSIYDGNETLVHSATMTDSGNGHYFHDYTSVTSDGFYSAKMVGYIGSLSYIRPEWFRITPMEVD